jgi:hypothetical protein
MFENDGGFKLDTFKIDIWYGTVELQQRPVCDARGFGYESRSVWRDRAGLVQKTSEWSPPLCWLRTGETEKPRRSWLARLFGAA